MSERHFDRIIKEVLDNLNPTYDPATWEALERRLDAQPNDAPTAADNAAWEIDIRQRLAHLSAPYDTAAWQLLFAKMRLRKQRQRFVYGAKALEAVLILLLIFLRYGNLTHSPAPPSLPPSASAVVQSLEGLLPSKSLSSGAFSEKLPPPRSNSIGTGLTAEVPPRRLSDAVGPEAVDKEWPEQPSMPPVELALAGQDSSPTHALSPLPLRMPEPLSWPIFAVVVEPLPPLAERPKAIASEQRVHLLAAAVLQSNHIHWPLTRQVVPGAGFSLRAEHQGDRWAWGAGMEYTHLAFAPPHAERIFQGTPQTGYYGVFLAQVNADMLLLPLAASRYLWGTNRWKTWITGGLTAHLALDKAYDYNYVYHPPGQLPPTQADPNAQPHLLERGRGLLEGGSLSSNAYVSADLGLRWQYRASESRFAWCIQPLYRRGLTPGISPGRERLHTWALHLGLRITP